MTNVEASTPSKLHVFDLPNEILIRTLLHFRTRDLLPLAAVCYRLHDLVLRVLHGRLLAAAALTDYKLILECFHPASKNLNPYLYCDYLGTPGLSDTTQGQGLVYHAEENIGRLGKLGGLYSRFRPIRPEEEHRIFVRQPVGDDASGGEGLGGGGGGVAAPQESSSPPPPYSFPSTINDSMGASRSSSGDGGGGLVSHNINLDTDERFSQLCVVTNLIKLGPRRGVFRSFVNVSEGLVRVMRDWLGKRAHALGAEDGETRTLWLDAQENVGIRVRVTERSWRRAAPVLLHRDEDPAVSYLVEYEELRVRTALLLFAVEQSILRDENAESGRAIVFGSFVSRGQTP